MQAHRDASEESKQASSAPLSQRGDSSMQPEPFAEAQPLMNGQADSMGHSQHGAGGESHEPSTHDSRGSNDGLRDRGRGDVSLGDSELLGQQTLDFWLNLCICHTLIVEQDDNGGPSVYQVQRLP